MIRVGSVRFFLAVTPAPAWLRLAMLAAALVGIATLWLSPREIDSALGSVLLLQMFAVSNGYRASASRGFFDPLLVSGREMWRVAGGNLVAAAFPGLLAWAVIVFSAAVLGQPGAAIAPQRHVALVVVSAVGWSVGLAMPRMAGGVLWAVLMLGFAMSRLALVESLVTLQRTTAGMETAVVAAAGMLCPFLLLGDFPALDTRVLLLDAAAAIGVALVGARYICRREHPLAEPS